MAELDLTDELKRAMTLLRSWLPPGVSCFLVLESEDQVEAAHHVAGPCEVIDGMIQDIREAREATDGTDALE